MRCVHTKRPAAEQDVRLLTKPCFFGAFVFTSDQTLEKRKSPHPALLSRILAIFLMFWHVAVNNAFCYTFFIPRKRQYRSPWSSLASAKLRSIVWYRSRYKYFPDWLLALAFTHSFYWRSFLIVIICHINAVYC